MTNEIVSTPNPWLIGGQSVQYAPGYYAYTRDPVVKEGLYSDASLEQARRQAIANPGRALNLQFLLAQAKYLPKDDVTGLWSEKVRGAMAKAMSDANSMYMGLGEYLQLRAGLAGGGGGGGGGGPRTSTSVSRSVRITSRASAQSLLKQTLTNELGREPTKEEVSAFVRSLNKAERANPTVSTTTTTVSSKGSSSNTVTKESQIDPGSEAETYAEKVDPAEAHRYQSGNYYDIIARMVGE